MSWDKTVALFCIFLIVSTTLVMAQSIEEDLDETEVGEIISIVVTSQDPTIVTSDAIEDNDIPVYAYLAAPSLGSLLDVDTNVEPLYNNLEVDRVAIRSLDASTLDKILGNIQYIAPVNGRITQDNLGFIQFRIKREEVEADIPDQYDFDFTGDFYFKNARRLFELAEQDLVLSEEPDENEWRDKQLDESQFFSKTGFLRVREIEDNKVYLTIYSGDSHYFLNVANPQPLDDLSLKVGEESDYYRVQEGDLPQDSFRIKLMDIVDPQTSRANLQVTINGVTYQTSVVEGMEIYPGSQWSVESIDTYSGTSGNERQVIKEIKIKSSSRNQETVRTTFGEGEITYANKWVKRLGIEKRLRAKDIDKIYDVLSELGLDNKISQDWENHVEIDSSVFGTSTDTISYTTQEGDSFVDILNQILPSNYAFDYDENADKFTIKKIVSNDPCENIKLVDDEELNSLQDNDEDRRRLYCTAINELSFVTNYPGIENEEGVLYEDLGYWYTAKAYEGVASTYGSGTTEKRNSLLLASENLARALGNNYLGPETSAAWTDYHNLEEMLKNEIDYDDVYIEDNGQTIRVRLSNVQETPPEKLPHAIMDVEGNGAKTNFFKGDYILADNEIEKDDNGDEYPFNYEIREINEDYIRYKKVYTEDTPSDQSEKTKTLNVGHSTSLNGLSVELEDVEIHKQAYLRVMPGTGKEIHATTNFSIHIPVEKRAFEIVPEEIDAKIEKIQGKIDKLEKHIESLTKIVKTWKTVCLATFGYLALKNSFVSGRQGAGNEARYLVINGADGSSGWARWCEENKAQYNNNYDTCMLQNAGQINEEINDATNALEKVNSDFDNGDYVDKEWYKDITSGYGDSLKVCENYLGENEFFPEDDLQMYAYWNYMKDSDSYSKYDGQDTRNLKSEVDTGIKTFQTVSEQKASQCNNAVQSLENYDLNSKNEEEQAALFNELYQQQLVESPVTSSEFDYLEEMSDEINKVQYVYKSGNDIVAYSANGEVKLEELTASQYYNYLDDKYDSETDPSIRLAILNEKEYVKQNYIDKGEGNEKIISSYGQVYKGDDGILYVATATAFSGGEVRTDYAEGAKIVYYSDGTPKALPTGYNGEYIKVLEYDKTGSASTVELWNVGLDGLVDTADDVLLKHKAVLALDPAEEIQLINFVNNHKRLPDGTMTDIRGNEFTVSYTGSRETKSSAASCFDVMLPQDCKTLFNVCDPVLCPPSRFNLNGNWEVENVIETGIVGSLVLGLGNGDTFPVCLTGVLAGLENIKSVLEGYVDCLETAKVDGEMVGVCDKIKSIYICDLVVKEAAAILQAKGGLLDLLSSKVFGGTDNSGGEYLEGVKSGFNNLENSINFFTQEYATTSFAGFQGLTTEEVGSMICRQAIYAKMPYFGDFVSELSEPESPPQFTALLTISEYSESQHEEQYQVYYHIYAGEDTAATYQVYLRNSITGEKYYVTEECKRTTGQIDSGEFADVTKTCITDEGYDEVCVNINGDTRCGFGTVTSTFALDYMTDLLEYDELQRDIDSEEECYPSYSKTSPSLGSVALPNQYGSLSNGIVRVCSLTNPGTGTDANRWSQVGTCGKDESGRSLGYCWMDRESITLTDASQSESASEYLDDLSFQYSLEDKDDLMDPDETVDTMNELLSTFNSAQRSAEKNTLALLPAQFRNVVSRGSDQESIAQAQLYIGISLYWYATTFSSATSVSYDEYDEDACKEHGCDISFIGDKICDTTCNIAECDWDGGDCEDLCNPGCDKSEIGDGVCDADCNVEDCNYDGGDCVIEGEEEIPNEMELFACDYCGEGAFNLCDMEECHDIGGNLGNICYYDDGLIPGFGGSCNYCSLIKECSDLNDDLGQCENSPCLSEHGLNCKISNDKCIEEGEEDESDTSPTSFTLYGYENAEDVKNDLEKNTDYSISSSFINDLKTVENRIKNTEDTTTRRTYFEIINDMGNIPNIEDKLVYIEPSSIETKRMIAGLLAVESGAQTDQTSSTGCSGLAQFCSGTAKSFETPCPSSMSTDNVCYVCGPRGCDTEDNRDQAEIVIPAALVLIDKKMQGIRSCSEFFESKQEWTKLGFTAYNGGEGLICTVIEDMNSPEKSVTLNDFVKNIKPKHILKAYCGDETGYSKCPSWMGSDKDEIDSYAESKVEEVATYTYKVMYAALYMDNLEFD